MAHIHGMDKMASLINTWMDAYKVTLKTKKAYFNRLHELQTWDKARIDNKDEHTAKIVALKMLINRLS